MQLQRTVGRQLPALQLDIQLVAKIRLQGQKIERLDRQRQVGSRFERLDLAGHDDLALTVQLETRLEFGRLRALTLQLAQFDIQCVHHAVHRRSTRFIEQT